MDDSQRSELTQSVDRSSGSFELVLGAVLFSVVGFFVDQWANTTPLFALVFGAVGFLGATVSIYYRYQYQMRQAAAQRPHLGSGQSDSGPLR